MTVAKRQKEKNPQKWNKGRSKDWSEDVRWNKQPSWLAQFTWCRLRGRRKKMYKMRSQNWASVLSSLRFFWVSSPSYLEDIFFFACQIKLSYNTGPSIASNFCCSETELKKLQTPLTGRNSCIRVFESEIQRENPFQINSGELLRITAHSEGGISLMLIMEIYHCYFCSFSKFW